MSEADNRSTANLIPLCEEHAFEIDATQSTSLPMIFLSGRLDSLPSISSYRGPGRCSDYGRSN